MGDGSENITVKKVLPEKMALEQSLKGGKETQGKTVLAQGNLCKGPGVGAGLGHLRNSSGTGAERSKGRQGQRGMGLVGRGSVFMPVPYCFDSYSFVV